MPLTSVTRLPGGLSNQPVSSIFADLKQPFPGTYAHYFTDFLPFVAADWTLTGTGSVAAATVGSGGLININSLAGAEQSMQSAILPFVPAITKELFFSARIAVDNAGLSGFFAGLVALDGTPYASSPTDGIFIKKTAGVTNATATLRVAGVDVAVQVMDVSFVAGTFVDVGFAYTPTEGALRAFVGDAAVRLATNPASFGAAIQMAPALSSFGAAGRTLAADYVYVAQGR